MRQKKHTALGISLFIFACIGVLALGCWLWPDKGIRIGELELKWPKLSEILETPTDTLAVGSEGSAIGIIDEPIDSAELMSAEPVVVAEPAKPVAVAPIKPVEEITLEPSDTVLEPVTRLTHLAAALEKADSVPVRVVYYGDSQIEGDRMTMTIRRALQALYGGGGVGLLPLHQTISSRTIIQNLKLSDITQSTGDGPQRYMAFGPMSARRENKIYGPMGQCAVLDDSLKAGSEHALWTAYAQKRKNTESYFNRVRVFASPTIDVNVHKATKSKDESQKSNSVYILPDSTTAVTIALNGEGDVYGICLESDHGVMVDNVPMRGCAGTIFTSINSRELRDYYQATNTKLIILQFGGNVVPYTHTTKQVNTYIGRVRNQIRYLKQLAGECDFVFVGPSDMVDKSGSDIHTHPAVPAIDKGLKQLCDEEGVLYFSLYNAMGGSGSMQAWKTRGWAGSDLIHFTRQGADKAGEMLAEWLVEHLTINDE